MATLLVWADIAEGTKYGVDNSGRVIATRHFLIRIDDGQTLTEPQRIALILNDPRIPRYDQLLFVGTALPAMYSLSPPKVVTIDVSLLGDEPNTYNVTIEYGYNETNAGSSEGGEPEDEPDETRERFPWEQDAEVNMSFGNSTEVTPETAGYMGNKSLDEVVAERGQPQAIQGTATEGPIWNTANDYFQSPPTKKLHTATMSISFSRLISWETVKTLNGFLFKVNRTGRTTWVDNIALDRFLPGTLMFVGWEASPSTYTDSRSWKKGKRHPFIIDEGYNNTKFDIAVYKYYTYWKYTLTFEYNPYGYIKYIPNIGFREIAFDSDASDGVIPLTPILGSDGTAITAPARLDVDGLAIPIDAPIGQSRFQKYKYYEDKDFTFMDSIPWEYKG